MLELSVETRDTTELREFTLRVDFSETAAESREGRKGNDDTREGIVEFFLD